MLGLVESSKYPLLQYVLIYDSKLISVQCNVGGIAEDKELVKDAFNSYLPVFQMIGNSIVITEKWINPNKNTKLLPGDTIFIPRKERFSYYWPYIQETIAFITGLATSIIVIRSLITN